MCCSTCKYVSAHEPALSAIHVCLFTLHYSFLLVSSRVQIHNDSCVSHGCSNGKSTVRALRHEYTGWCCVVCCNVPYLELECQYKVQCWCNLVQLRVAQDSTIEVVVDKATLDCLMNCNDWQVQVNSMLTECWRVLKPGGKWVAACIV